MNDCVLLDTHTWAWSLLAVGLTSRAASTMQDATFTMVSPISVFEIAQKVHLGKWPEMAPKLPNLHNSLAQQGGLWADLTPEIALLAGTLNWPHRDPFDRMLAATALVNGWVLISADTAFDSLIGLRRVW